MRTGPDLSVHGRKEQIMIAGVFTVQAQDGSARAGELRTAHGLVRTPIFMPVGTQGSVKSLSPDDLHAIGTQIILGNTYHLYLRPGDEMLARRGGLHEFMRWPKPILTDSGGFQVFSLAKLRRLRPDGVEFSSHHDGSKHFFSPEKVMGIQENIGSDIMMVLDECVPYGADFTYTQKSLETTTAWAKRCRAAHPAGKNGQLVFGIAQGGFFKELRERSIEEITGIDFDGFALGGLSVGESKEEMMEILYHSAPLLPVPSPRYLMGVGTPLDILHGINAGIDMFDCVLPTRNARNGTLFTSTGKINIKKATFREDDSVLDANCQCYTCCNFSRAYLCHLYHSRELLAYRLNTIHNLAFFLDLVRGARKAVFAGRFQQYLQKWEEVFDCGFQID